MNENLSPNQSQTEVLGGDPLKLPAASNHSKLPLPRLPEPTGHVAVPEEIAAAWRQHMVNGFKQNEQMFKNTLAAFMKPYRLLVYLYASLYVIGIGLFLVAIVIGLQKGDSVVAISFAGLSVAAFLGFFVRQPLQALEENLEFITWLGVAFNTYWTRLMFMTDPTTVQTELKAADDDFRASVDRLIAKHAELCRERPGTGSKTAEEHSNAKQS